MAEIRLHAVAHSYRTRLPEYVLEDFDLCFDDGGAYALLGPSGCGKTTLLNIISGLITPTRGRVTYDGRDVTACSPARRNIAQVFQFPVVYDTMSVYDNLAFPLRNRGIERAAVATRVEHIAELLQLSGVLGRRATGLTADEKQLISLGRGLVRDDVAAILFDEPLTVIDPHRKWHLRRTLRAIREQFRHTMIYVTHDQTEALTFADQVIVMRDGRVLQNDTPQELFERPAHTYVGYFIGSPGMNLAPCEIRDGAAVVAGHRVPLPAALADQARELAGGLVLGIRPQHIAPCADSDDAGGLPVTVRAIADHGRFLVITGALGDIELRLELPVGSEIRVDDTYRVVFPPERICLYHDEVMVKPAPAASEA